MKSLTREEIIALAERLALPDSHRLTYEFTEFALMEFVAEILNAVTTKSRDLENFEGLRGIREQLQ